MKQIRKLFLASCLALAPSLALAQANGVSTFQTPGNSTVPGYVPLGVSPSGVAGGAGLGNAGYPSGATPQAQHSTTSNGGSSASLSLTGVAGQHTYVCGWRLATLGATSATTVLVTVGAFAGGGGNISYPINVPVIGTTYTIISDTYNPCLRTPGTGQSPTLAIPQTAGNTANALLLDIWGYTQ